jgi:hypothetical protein
MAVQANRQTLAVSHNHHFAALAELRCADGIASLCAGPKLPTETPAPTPTCPGQCA